MANFIENPIKIYLKDSDKVRLADCRVRIVRDIYARCPAANESLVFIQAPTENDIPKDAIYTWKWNNFYFYTTVERCKEMVSADPSYWTQDKLKGFAEIEEKLWEDWINVNVYGYIIEKWDEKRREWVHTNSLYGMYGAKDLFDNLVNATDGVSIPVCIDNEDMKYDFKNVEMKLNQFE